MFLLFLAEIPNALQDGSIKIARIIYVATTLR